MEGDRTADTLFSCVDPLGQSVVARRHRWNEHIRARHPEVAPHPTAVRATLEAPAFIVADFDNPDGLNYFRLAALPAPYDRLYLKVVVSFDRVGAAVVGDVIAAYPTRKAARGEVQRWP